MGLNSALAARVRYVRYRTERGSAAAYFRGVGVLHSTCGSELREGNIVFDDTRHRGPLNRSDINVHDFELRYWARELNVSVERVRSAVKKVGPALTDVRDELERQGF